MEIKPFKYQKTELWEFYHGLFLVLLQVQLPNG